MANKFTARRGIIRTPRRETLWIGSDNSLAVTTTIGATQVVLNQSFSTTTLARRPFTIVRTRGFIFVQSDQVAALEEQIIGMGMSVVSEQAIAVGVTAVPDPYADLGSDLFFVHKIGMKGMESNGDLRGAYWEFDSKAMRKVEDGQDVAVVIRNISSAFGADFFIVFRMLIKTH